MKAKKPTCSIIIPSFKRAHLLKWGLHSLSQQKCSYSFEIIVLNDGIPDETEKICELYKNKLNIKYVFTGQRNLKHIFWRCPGYAINIGVKRAKGKYIILTCPEIFHMDNRAIQKVIKNLINQKKKLVKTFGKDDRKGLFLEYIENTKGEIIDKSKVNSLKGLQTHLPFFLGMNKKDYLTIGGYDEDFIGWAYDDTDFIARLRRYGCTYTKINSTIIHLYHPRHRIGLKSIMQLYHHNKNLYEKKDKEGIIYSNVGKIWGQMKDSEDNKKLIDMYKERKIKWNLNRIPKVAHFYWGEEILPFLRYLTVLSFHKFNSDWKIKFYVPLFPTKTKTWTTNEQKYQLTGANYFSKLKKMGVEIITVDMRALGVNNNISEVHKSDFLRWYLLAIEGGLWSDMDIIYFESMNQIKINREDYNQTDTVVCIGKDYGHSIGFMLSSPKNRYFDYLFAEARKKFNSSHYQSIGVKLLNKEFSSIESINKRFPVLFPKNISESTVYPYNATKINEIYTEPNLCRITKNTIGLHWYAGHPLAGKMVNKVCEENWQEFDKVIGLCMKKALNDNFNGRNLNG